MKFVFKVWKFSVTVDLFDLDTTDSNIAFSVTVAWKQEVLPVQLTVAGHLLSGQGVSCRAGSLSDYL